MKTTFLRPCSLQKIKQYPHNVTFSLEMSLTTYLDSSIERITEADDNDDISNKSEENKREFGYEIKIGSSMKFPYFA